MSRALAVLSVMGILLVGCADDPATDGDPGAAAGGANTDGAASGDAPVGLASLLEELPQQLATGGGLVQVAIADLDQAAALAGIDRPAGSTDPDTVSEYVNAVSGVFIDGPPVAALLPEMSQATRAGQVDEFAAELGWTVADVSWFAEYQVLPNTYAALGGLDESRITDVLGTLPDDGIWRIGSDDYGINPDESSAARPIGEALRQAPVDNHVVISRTTGPVEAALVGGPTLADDATLSTLAAAMDDEEAYSARLLSGQPSDFQIVQFPTPDVATQADIAGATALTEPFTGVAVGSTQIDGTPHAIFAYVHDDKAAAATNADSLRALVTEGASINTGHSWSDMFEVADIRVDGTTVVARLTIGERPPVVPYQLLLERDNLTSHTHAVDGG